jgi:hypothetical protein
VQAGQRALQAAEAAVQGENERKKDRSSTQAAVTGFKYFTTSA